MGYKLERNAQLFDALIEVLNKHYKEPGAVMALDDLQAAKVNYLQGSIDQMISCLVFVIHDLATQQNSDAFWNDLKGVIYQFYGGMFQGPKLTELAQQYEANGGRPLTQDEILKEVDERRGASR